MSEPAIASSPAAVEVKTSLPSAGELQLLELARATDQELAGGAPGQPGNQAAAPAPAPIALERKLAGLFAMMGAGAGHFLPSVQKVLDEPACEQLGDAIAPVARKYGLDRWLEGFEWKEELQAAMIAGPIALAIVAAAKHDLAAMRAAQAAAASGQVLGAPTPAPASSPPADASPPVPKLEPIA